MSRKELRPEVLEKAWDYATKNTKYNEKGQAVISRDDDFEDEWVDDEREGSAVKLPLFNRD